MLLRMDDPHERLRSARTKAGFKEAAEAARAYGWNEVTYTSHENGTRGLRPAVAARYAKAFRVSPEWLLYARAKPTNSRAESPKTVPLIGHLGPGSTIHFSTNRGVPVAAPEGATEDTVAIEVRGESLGPFDGWLLFYDDVRRPIAPELIGRLCVVSTEQGEVLVKKIQRSRARGLFHLLSQTDGPILDAALQWGAPVRGITRK